MRQMQFERWKLVSIRDGKAWRSALLHDLSPFLSLYPHTLTHARKHKQRTDWFDLGLWSPPGAASDRQRGPERSELQLSLSPGCLC